MTKSWTIGQQIAFGFLIPILILMTLGTVAYESMQRLMQTSYLVANSNEVVNTISGLDADVQDVVMGQRGFVITGKDEFLEPYTRGITGWKKSFDHLRD